MNQTHFSFWPNRVPKTLVYPQTPLFEFLETSARRFPEHPAIIFYGTRTKYSDLWDFCLRLAGALAASGIKKGDRIALTTAEEIISWSKKQMSAYKYPRLIEFVDSLPKSGAGKILWR
ncbi:MAG: AMP-binding protein [Desulfobacterales bacterium]